MTDNPVERDEHRGMAAQKSTEIRRRLHEVQADQAALRHRQEDFERHALAALDSSPRTFQRKAGSNIAPLLQPRPKSSTEQRGRGTRIPLGGVAGLPDRPELHRGAGEFPSIFG